MEQTATAKNEMEAALQRLEEECEHLKQEHQKTLAEKMEELNNVKVWEKRMSYASVCRDSYVILCTAVAEWTWKKHRNTEGNT